MKFSRYIIILIALLASANILPAKPLDEIYVEVGNTTDSYYRGGQNFIRNNTERYIKTYKKLSESKELLNVRNLKIALKLLFRKHIKKGQSSYDFMFERYPKKIQQFLLGMASEIEYNPKFADITKKIKPKDLVVYMDNSMLNIMLKSDFKEPFGCSMLANLNNDGSLTLGRNFDWRANSSYEQSSELVIMSYHNLDTGTIVKTIGDMGRIGTVTAGTNYGTFYELNSALGSVGLNLGPQFLDFQSHMLEILIDNNNYTNVINEFKKLNMDFPSITTIAGKKEDGKYDVFVSENSTYKFKSQDTTDKIFYTINDSNNDFRKNFSEEQKHNYPYDKDIHNLIAITNNFRSTEWSNKNLYSNIWNDNLKLYGDVQGQPLDTITASQTRYNNLLKLALDYRDNNDISSKSMKKIFEAPLVDENDTIRVNISNTNSFGATEYLSSRFYNEVAKEEVNETTIYSTVFNSEDLSISYRVQNQNNNLKWSKWHKIYLNEVKK